MIERRAHRYHRFTLQAGLEFADDLVEVGRRPGMQVGQADRLAFVRVGGQIDQPGVGSLAAGSCMYFCATRTSLKLRHLTPYICGPIQ